MLPVFETWVRWDAVRFKTPLKQGEMLSVFKRRHFAGVNPHKSIINLNLNPALGLLAVASQARKKRGVRRVEKHGGCFHATAAELH